MARINRLGRAIFPTILLICAGCGAKGTTSSPMIVAPSARPPEAAASESTSGSPAATKREPIEASSLPSSDAPPAQPGVEPATVAARSELFRESFAGVSGSIQWNRDGGKSAEGPPSERTIYFFNGLPEGGPLVMRIVEDGSLAGPDGEPGVLALSWQEMPQKLPYSGFAYLGGRDAAKRMTLPLLAQAKSGEDLRPFRLTFRYQGMNERRDLPFSLNIGCRLEPLLADSYAKRLDLGTLIATGEWGSFEIGLADGKNPEAFLRAIAQENPPGFKLIWSQTGPLTNYRPGDTLFIDDIVIASSPRE